MLRLCAAILVLSLSGCNHEPPLPAGDRLVLLVPTAPRDLDPRFSIDATSMRVSRLIYEPLVSVDNAELVPRPSLATRWEESDDGLSWTMHLRTDVSWHDGMPLSAEDVVFTYQSVMDPTVGSPYRDPYQRHLSGVEVVDHHTVRFRLKEPYATFLTDMVLGIVPSHTREIVGTGPFRLMGRTGGRRLDLKRASGWWGGRAGVENIVVRTVTDEGTRLLALLGGSADLSQNGISPTLTTVLEDDDRLKVSYHPSIAFTYVALNLREAGLSDRRVRQALALAIPRETLIETHLGGHATLATGMLAPMHWAYEGDVARYDYDPDRARTLLASAGIKPGELSVTIKISTDRFRRTLARSLAQAWREIGVDATVRSFEFGTFFADVKAGNFQAYILDLPEPMEPDMYRWMLHSLSTPTKAPSGTGSPYALADRRFLSPGALDDHVTRDPICGPWQRQALSDATRNWVQRAFGVEPAYSTANRMFYANPLVDCHVELGLRETDPEKRRPHYAEVQRLVALDLPVIPLWHPDLRVISSRRTSGFVPLPNARLAGLAAARVDQPGSQ